MKAVIALAVVAPLLLVACSSDERSYIPPGTYAGSLNDQPFTLDVGEKVHVNKVEGRFVKRGVIEIRHKGVRETVTCKVSDDKGEELRCDVRTAPSGGAAPTTEVIDLMLL